MTIYIVRGTNGQYSERTDWPVIAFTDEEKAKTRVVDATNEAKRIEGASQNPYLDKSANKYDPNMQMDYTGTTYYYETVELVT